MASFIQDVLSSVNYDVNIHIASDVFSENTFIKRPSKLSPIVIWDLDSFEGKNETSLPKIRENSEDSLVLAYALQPEKYSHIPAKFYDTLLSHEAVRLHLMSSISKLREIHQARKIFSERMSHLVGKSEAMRKTRKTVERAILHTGPVLIQGESGVGKDLVAKAIACMYDKFITVNCSAIPDSLFESELFGHTRGAFTGAQNERVGLFEDANGGAIFLDEIGDMPIHAQVKLLRVIQNHEIRPIGANKTKHINVRIIAATNRDLREEIKEKRFREDLFYRLNVIPVLLSPLRERLEDIDDLANYFIQQYAPQEGMYSLSGAALQKLKEHNWPGNIRELENVIQRALCFTDPGTLNPDDLQIDNIQPPSFKCPIRSYSDFRSWQLEQEKIFLREKIMENEGSIGKTAEKLGLIRTALYNRLNRLGIDLQSLKN